MAGRLPLVIGLGNPGAFYERTRHNFGFEVLDELARRSQGSWEKLRFASAQGCQIEGGTWLVKPGDYMNLSGPVARDCLKWFKLEPEEMLVVVDDVNLPLGKLRMRRKGSAGGHNGLGSIESSIGTQSYPRLRGGIAEVEQAQGAEPRGDLKDFVLGRFSLEEWKIVERMKEKTVEIIRRYQAEGFEAAQQVGNTSV